MMKKTFKRKLGSTMLVLSVVGTLAVFGCNGTAQVEEKKTSAVVNMTRGY
ncbi:MAG: hypothetical protein PHW47_00145 [Lachnospira sp.]|nr:hypothetical protein [Lachnospira sp.]